MSTTNNIRGFSFIIVFGAIFIVTSLVGIGVYVYKKSSTATKESSTTGESITTTIGNDPGPIDETKQVLEKYPATQSITVNGITLSVPNISEGWKLSERCNDQYVVVLPPDKDNIKCGTEDFGDAGFGLTDNYEALLRTCEEHKARITENGQNGGSVPDEFSCETIEISGYKGLKVVTSYKKDTEIYGPGTSIEYTIFINDKTIGTYAMFVSADADQSQINDFNKMALSTQIK